MTQKSHDTGDNNKKQQGSGHIGEKVLEEDKQNEGVPRKIDPELSGEKGDQRNARDVPPGAPVLQPDNAPNAGMKKSGSGAVKGGEAAKPGQMQGDEDESAKGP